MRLFRATVPFALLLIPAAGALIGCAKEPPAPAASVAPAAPAPSDSPDKLYAELAKCYGDAATVLAGYYDGNGTDPEARAKAFSLEMKRLDLVMRSNAMLAANPSWKDSCRQWFDQTVTAQYARFAKQRARHKAALSPKAGSSTAELDAALGRFKATEEEASKVLARIDPAAQSRFDLRRSNDIAAKRQEQQQAEEAWKTFRDGLGLPESDYPNL